MLHQLDRCAMLQMEEALRNAGLPSDDLRDDLLAFRLDDRSGLVGWAALEMCGDYALLRSVLVDSDRRGSGAGSDLVRQVIGVATDAAVTELWLLTETAAPFFERLGFRHAERSAAPEAIRATSEFREKCPTSATCMMLSLSQG